MKRRKTAKRNWRLWYVIGGVALIVICLLLVLLTRSSDNGDTDPALSNGDTDSAGNGTQAAQNALTSSEVPPAETEIAHEDGFTQPTEGTEPAFDLSVRGALYWNVDRGSSRKTDENGNYKIRFAYDGTLVEKSVADKHMVDFIDTMDVMSLVFDANGVIIDVLDPNDVAVELSKNVYVKTVSADALEISSTADLNGYIVNYPLGETTGIYDVIPGTKEPGRSLQPAELKAGDTVQIFGDGEGNVTHIFVTAHAG